MRATCGLRIRCLLAALAHVVAALSVAAPSSAQDAPNPADLPVLTTPGALAASEVPDRSAWLSVDTPGLYSVGLDGPGALALFRYDAPGGLSDGSAPVRQVLATDDPDAAGRLDDLLLLPGESWLVAISSEAPRGIVLNRTRAVDLSTATRGASGTVARLDPGTDLLVIPDGQTTLTIAPGATLRLEALAPPGLGAIARLGEAGIGPGGVFPLAAGVPVPLDLSAEPGIPILLRASAAPGRLDEAEPGPTDLGPLPFGGSSLRAALLAPTDRDSVRFTLDAAGTLDIALQVADDASARLQLYSEGDGVARDLIAGVTRQGTLRRDGLALPAGAYRVDISGDQPAPLRYRLELWPSGLPSAGEPDDRPDLARPLRPGDAANGTLGPDDPAVYRLAIDRAAHLWEVALTGNVATAALTAPYDIPLADWPAENGALTLRLALPPGPFLLGLTGDGPYAIGLADLGPLPPGRESEPNDDWRLAQPLRPGDSVAGDFQSAGDVDAYEIALGAPTPLRLDLIPAERGAVDLRLTPAGGVAQSGTLAPGTGPWSYSATLPAGRTLLELWPRDADRTGDYRLSLSLAQEVEPFEPGGLIPLARDGRHEGTIGGLDDRDRILAALPDRAGAALLRCRGAGVEWSATVLGVDGATAFGTAGQPVILAFGPAPGARLDWQVSGPPAPVGYACRLAFAPTGPIVAATSPATGPVRLTPGTATTVVFAGPEPRPLLLDLPDGALGAFRCDLPVERLRSDDYAVANGLAGPALDDGSRVFAGGPDPVRVEARPDPDLPFPQETTCLLYPESALTTPGMAGVVPEQAPDRQETADLAVALSVEGADLPFRAGALSGQSAELTLRLENPGPARSVALDLAALAPGWRLEPGTARLDLPEGGSATMPLRLVLPPMQGVDLSPALRLVARAGGQRASLVLPVRLDPAAPERGAGRFWTAPDGLRGGLDPLRGALGGRLVALDGVPIDEGAAQAWGFLTDDLALDGPPPPLLEASSATFRLAEVAPITGAFVRLGPGGDRGPWPDALTLELSRDGEVWSPPVAMPLSGAAGPQLMTFPGAPVEAAYLRITRGGCRADPDCPGVALADVGLIADPDWRPGVAPDIASPALGGHVVAARARGGPDDERIFGPAWNIDLLTDGTPTRLAPVAAGAGDSVEAILAFNRSRAAAIAAIEWHAAPDDPVPAGTAARVEASVDGPAGPWTGIGTLAPPDTAGVPGRLDLPSPVWARALRLTFPRDASVELALPDRISVTEDPALPSVLGFWEDDRPDAGYEDRAAGPPLAEALPAGGADAKAAVPLPFDVPQRSSVQIERNEDWWALDVPKGPPRRLDLRLSGPSHPDVGLDLRGPYGRERLLSPVDGPGGPPRFLATLPPGRSLLRVYEPPRAIAILWDTSESVEEYLPAILTAVPAWALGLQPGRDRLQLLPFGATGMLLPEFAETPDAVAPALAGLGPNASSDAEAALGIAATALADEPGLHGIIVVTDAETAQADLVWGPLLAARPRVVALSIGSSDPAGLTIMRDWAMIAGGRVIRVDGHGGMAGAMDLAAALFRAPKSYGLSASLADLPADAGQARLVISADAAVEGAPPGGAIELVLDASGSMLQRLPDGTRKIAAAHYALAGLVERDLPDGIPFAFRSFGLAPGSCESRLDLPLGPLDPASAAAAIRQVSAVNLARTAIADSLAAAADDLAPAPGPHLVVLLTDGEETCDGDVEATLAALRARGVDIRLTIVGFAIDDAAIAATFADWAGASGGQYLPASDMEGLGQQLASATRPRFLAQRLDDAGTLSGDMVTLALGEEVALAAGRWRLTPVQSATGGVVEVRLETDSRTELRYDPAEGLRPIP